MLIVRHLGAPILTSMDITVCVIQYYTDQWLNPAYIVSAGERSYASVKN